jgi:hypothetical protein
MFNLLARLKLMVTRHHDYCVRCRAHQRVSDVEYTDLATARGPRRSRRGTCTVCGVRTSVFVSA